MSNASPTSQIIGQKRPRTDSELREDPELWLSDGNVVLTANDDEGTTWGIRCHKSILSKHSTVFEGMFPLKQPENAEMYDGLPLVALSDRYADLRGLLRMLYDPIRYIFTQTSLFNIDHRHMFVLPDIYRNLPILYSSTMQRYWT